MSNLPQEHPFGQPHTIEHLIHEALEYSENIILRHRAVFRDLGLGVNGPMSSDQICWILSVALEEAAASKDGHKDLRALFEMLCAVEIKACFKIIASEEDSPGAMYLVAFWHGILSAVKWMDEDKILGAFKELHRSELSRMARAAREDKKAEELARLVAMACKLREASLSKEAIDTILDDVLSQSSNGLITFENLVIQCFDQDIDELAQKGLSLWQAGSKKFHGAMANELLKKVLPKSRTKTVIRKELMRRLADLATKNGFADRVRGSIKNKNSHP